MTEQTWVRNEARVDLAAVAHNVAELRSLSGDVPLCAVVKANAYGHGSVMVARAALDAGASWLAVAHASEGVVLREAGIDAPILLLSEPRPNEIDDVLHHGIRPSVYSLDTARSLVAAIERTGSPRSHPVQVKVNTGMNRVGVKRDDSIELCRYIASEPTLDFEGLWTHFAVADVPGDDYTDRQLDDFETVVAELAAAGLEPAMIHAANSAGTIDHPRSHLDLVRCGIALYGIDPAPELAGRLDLRPALSLHAEVGFVKTVPAGVTLSYGRRVTTTAPTTVATLCIGYADGVPRRLWESGEVLIGGTRRRILGVVTMDQLMVDCGSDPVEVGDEAVLIGAQGGDRITAADWAEQLGTIGYEIVCGISARVPRRHV